MAMPYLFIKKESDVLRNLYTIKNVYYSLQKQKYTTPQNYELTYKDVWNGIAIMNKKHKLCEWVNDDLNYPRIELEGYYWLREVYFNKSLKLIDGDILFLKVSLKIIKKCVIMNRFHLILKRSFKMI